MHKNDNNSNKEGNWKKVSLQVVCNSQLHLQQNHIYIFNYFLHSRLTVRNARYNFIGFKTDLKTDLKAETSKIILGMSRN